MHYPNRRCAYICSIIDIDNKPMFRIRVQENEQIEEYCDCTAKGVWQKIINEIDLLRRKHGLVKMFSVYITGEDLFGLTVNEDIRKNNLEKKKFYLGTTYNSFNRIVTGS